MAAVPDREPPSAASIALGSAIISGLFGYFLGQARSIGLFGGGGSGASHPTVTWGGPGRSNPRGLVADDEDGDESDSEGEDEVELRASGDALAGNEECKLVLVVRTDLGMGKGKIAAQCGHATLACYKTMLRASPSHAYLKRWETLGQAKVALRVDSEDEMLVLQAQAVSLGLCARVIHDAGRTQIASGSATVLGIGPAPKSLIDEVTGHLKLL